MALKTGGGTTEKPKATAVQSKLALQSGLGYTLTGVAPIGQMATPNVAPIVQPYVVPGLVPGAGGYASLGGGPVGAPTATVHAAPAPPYPGIYPQYQTPIRPTGTTPYPGIGTYSNPLVATSADMYGYAQPTLSQQMASVYAANPRLSALAGTPGTLQPPTAFEDLYARSGLGEGLAVSGAGYAMTHGARVPTPWEILMQKDYTQPAGGTIGPTEVKDRTQEEGGTLAPTLPPLIVAKPPSYTPRRSGTGFGNYGYTPSQGYAPGPGLVNWRIGY